MPARIPVCIADKPFPSLNQARIYYRDILHRYQPGQSVNEQDSKEVMQLMSSSGLSLPVDNGPNVVRVVQGNYGRSCFARCGGENPHVISIARSIKECLVKNGSESKAEAARASFEPTVDVAASSSADASARTRSDKVENDESDIQDR